MWVQRDSNLGLVEYESAALEPELCARGYTAPTSFERRATIRNGTRVVGPLRSAVAPMPVATRAAAPRFRWVDTADWPTTSSGVLRSWPRSRESLSRHSFRSTSSARQALLSMSTAPLWVATRPAPSAGLVVVADVSPHLSRELVIRAVAYRMQEVALGGLRPEPQHQLHQIAMELKQNWRGGKTFPAAAEARNPADVRMAGADFSPTPNSPRLRTRSPSPRSRSTICDPHLFTIASWIEGAGVDTSKVPRVMNIARAC
jgi:hypothetical protein